MNNSINELTEYDWLNCKNPKSTLPENESCRLRILFPQFSHFMGGGTLNHDLLDFFELDSALPTLSAFIHQRAKILPEAFETLFHTFTDEINQYNNIYKGFRLLEVDGSDLQIASNPDDPDSFYSPATEGKPCNLLHINAMYDLYQHGDELIPAIPYGIWNEILLLRRSTTRKNRMKP